VTARAERATQSAEDRRLIAAFLEMMAAEAGAARNTLLAYERDLRGASELLGGRLAAADAAALRPLAEAWLELKRATVARKAAALRRFYGFLQDEGIRIDDPSPALPRPASERPLPKILDHRAVDALFAEIERRKEEGGVAALRLAALIELLYGSGLRATELVSLPRNAISPDRPFLILRGKGGRERLVPISDRARAAVAAYAALVPRDAAYLFPSGKKPISAGSGSTSSCASSPPMPASRPSGSARTSSATPSPPICSKAAPTCARCRCCSAMPTSPPPRSTPMSIQPPPDRAGQCAASAGGQTSLSLQERGVAGRRPAEVGAGRASSRR
jgi:integrase/recombinase XerD